MTSHVSVPPPTTCAQPVDTKKNTPALPSKAMGKNMRRRRRKQVQRSKKTALHRGHLSASHTCSICLDSIHNSLPIDMVVQCSHVFHHACIQRLRNHTGSYRCPECQGDIPLSDGVVAVDLPADAEFWDLNTMGGGDSFEENATENVPNGDRHKGVNEPEQETPSPGPMNSGGAWTTAMPVLNMGVSITSYLAEIARLTDRLAVQDMELTRLTDLVAEKDVELTHMRTALFAMSQTLDK